MVALHSSSPAVQKNLSDGLKRDFIEASCAWDVYKPVDVHNAKLVQLVSDHLGVSTSEANSTLMGRIKVPKRKRDGKSDTMVAYRYLKRTVSHFYEGLGRAAVKGFLASVKQSTGMGTEVAARGRTTRTSVELSAEQAAFFLSDDRFLNELYGHVALLAGAQNMFASLSATHLFTATVPETRATNVVCLFAHFALVVTKVREHLKLRVGVGAAGGVADNTGINEGHRDPWVREMTSLDVQLWRTPQAMRGLRLVDAASPSRASPVRPSTPESGAAAADAGGSSGAAAVGAAALAGGGGAGRGDAAAIAALEAGGAATERLD